MEINNKKFMEPLVHKLSKQKVEIEQEKRDLVDILDQPINIQEWRRSGSKSINQKPGKRIKN